MSYLIRQSAIFTIICLVFSKIKTTAINSASYRLLQKIMNFFSQLSEKSGIKHLFFSGGKTEEKWCSSITFRIADSSLNFIPHLIGATADRFSASFEGSHIIRMLKRLGTLAPYTISATMFILLSIHHKHWNNVYSLALAVLALGLFWLKALNGKRFGRIELEHIGFWPFVFAALSLASAFWSQDFSSSYRFIFFLITCALFMAVCISSINSSEQLYTLMLSCAAGLIVCCSYGFYQRFVLGIPASSSFTDLALNASMPGRVYSFFDNPNTFANVLVFFAPLMLTLTIYSEKHWMKAVFALALVLAIAALLMTYSRGAWLAFAASIAVVTLLLKPRMIPFFIIIVFLLLPFLPDSITNRIVTIFTGNDSSINSRSYIYTAMYRLIADYPLTGVGLGASAVKKIADYGGYYQAHFPFVHAHNIYMEIWAESGAFALFSFLLTVFFALKKGVNTARRNVGHPLLKGVGAGCVGGITGALIFGITDYAWYYPRVMVFFWLLAAIVHTAAKLSVQAGKPDKIV